MNNPKPLGAAEAFSLRPKNQPSKSEAEVEYFLCALEEGRARYCPSCGNPYFVAEGHECAADS